MKEIFTMTKSTEWEYLSGPVEISTKESTIMMKDMEMVKCYGLMVASTKENGATESSTVLVELYFLMEPLRKAILKTTSISIH
jgi:hypothetical protein